MEDNTVVEACAELDCGDKARLEKSVEFETAIWKLGDRYVIPIDKRLSEDFDLRKIVVKVVMTPKETQNYTIRE